MKQIRLQESTYRMSRLKYIQQYSNYYLAGLGKQNVHRRFLFVLWVHHHDVLSRGPYHGHCHARSAGGDQAARKSNELNSALVEADTTHWYSEGEKCPHEQNQFGPPCNRCRVPVRVLCSWTGEPKVSRGDEFFVTYHSLMKKEDILNAKSSDKYCHTHVR